MRLKIKAGPRDGGWLRFIGHGKAPSGVVRLIGACRNVSSLLQVRFRPGNERRGSPASSMCCSRTHASASTAFALFPNEYQDHGEDGGDGKLQQLPRQTGAKDFAVAALHIRKRCRVGN